jgi:hypothetical protein
MSEQTSEQRSDPEGGVPGDAAQDAAAAGVTDESAGNLTVEDDPRGTHDPADLAGTGDAGDDGVE